MFYLAAQVRKFLNGGDLMSNKLVYISGIPYWMTPEGRFMNVEIMDGMPVEHIIMRGAAK